MSLPQMQSVESTPVLYTATVRRPESRELVQKTLEEWKRVIYGKWMDMLRVDAKSTALEQISDSAAVISDLSVHANASYLKTVIVFDQHAIHGVCVVLNNNSHRELLFMATAPSNIPPCNGTRVSHVGAALLRHISMGSRETTIFLKSTKSATGFYERLGCDRLVVDCVNHASHRLTRSAQVALRERYSEGIIKTKDAKEKLHLGLK